MAADQAPPDGHALKLATRFWSAVWRRHRCDDGPVDGFGVAHFAPGDDPYKQFWQHRDCSQQDSLQHGEEKQRPIRHRYCLDGVVQYAIRSRFHESSQAMPTYRSYFDQRFNDTYVGFMKRHSNYLVTIQRRVDPIRWTRTWR